MGHQSFERVWDALEAPGAAAAFRARAEILTALQEALPQEPQARDAMRARLGLEEAELAALAAGQIDRFTLDDLVHLAGRAGLSVGWFIEPVALT